MKDRQIPIPGGEPRIPVLSPLLHCWAMTATVFLRSSFGFVYLGPKSVFFAFSWAFTLFVFYSLHEPGAWAEYRAICIFGIAATALYWLHLLIAFIREWGLKGRHDRYSGESHLAWILRRLGMTVTPAAEARIHLWVEPGIVLAAAVCLQVEGEAGLSRWLKYAAACFWLKEALNRWFELRYRKRQKDIFDDMSETETPSSDAGNVEPPKAARKERVRRERNTAASDETAKERHFAQILRLRLPYALKNAEENYRTLIKLEHPDATGEDSPETNANTAELNEAIEFFREKFH